MNQEETFQSASVFKIKRLIGITKIRTLWTLMVIVCVCVCGNRGRWHRGPWSGAVRWRWIGTRRRGHIGYTI